jgi:hypothetical protein
VLHSITDRMCLRSHPTTASRKAGNWNSWSSYLGRKDSGASQAMISASRTSHSRRRGYRKRTLHSPLMRLLLGLGTPCLMRTSEQFLRQTQVLNSNLVLETVYFRNNVASPTVTAGGKRWPTCSLRTASIHQRHDVKSVGCGSDAARRMSLQMRASYRNHDWPSHPKHQNICAYQNHPP